MVKNSKSSDPNPRQRKRACLPQFRATWSRNNAATSNTSSVTSSVISVQRSTSGQIRTQERERQHPASLRIPEDPSPPSPDPPQDPQSPQNLPPSPSIEEPPRLKRKRACTNKVTLLILYLTTF